MLGSDWTSQWTDSYYELAAQGLAEGGHASLVVSGRELIYGVNLPVDRVMIHLHMDSYAEMKQLCGRAGRTGRVSRGEILFVSWDSLVLAMGACLSDPSPEPCEPPSANCGRTLDPSESQWIHAQNLDKVQQDLGDMDGSKLLSCRHDEQWQKHFNEAEMLPSVDSLTLAMGGCFVDPSPEPSESSSTNCGSTLNPSEPEGIHPEKSDEVQEGLGERDGSKFLSHRHGEQWQKHFHEEEVLPSMDSLARAMGGCFVDPSPEPSVSPSTQCGSTLDPSESEGMRADDLDEVHQVASERHGSKLPSHRQSSAAKKFHNLKKQVKQRQKHFNEEDVKVFIRGSQGMAFLRELRGKDFDEDRFIDSLLC